MRLLLAVCLLLGASCAAPYHVVRAVADGPLATATPVTVFPVSYAVLTVDGLREAEHVARSEDPVAWAERKARWDDRLRAALVTGTVGRAARAASDTGAGLVMEIAVLLVEQGSDDGVLARPSRTRAVARLRLAGSDEVLYEVASETSHGGPGDRVAADHAALGAILARFLNDQLAPRR